jgi:predicted molibdopterin-dependent oxidoreductase YjgC
MADQVRTSVAARLKHNRKDSPIQVEIDGIVVPAYAGESVAGVLMASGSRIFTQASPYNLARTLFCGMGVCHQCLVTVEGMRNVRACMTIIRPGMKIETNLLENPLDDTG